MRSFSFELHSNAPPDKDYAVNIQSIDKPRRLFRTKVISVRSIKFFH